MKIQIEERLQSLEAEYAAGQKMLAELDARRGSLASTLLRIEGAIQVLKELEGAEPPAHAGLNGSAASLRSPQ